MQISRVGIVGAGNMASNLATLMLWNGVETILIGHSQDSMLRCRDIILSNFDELIAAGAMYLPNVRTAMKRLTITSQWDALSEVGLVLEAAKDDLGIKSAVIKKIEETIHPDAPLLISPARFPLKEFLSGAVHPKRIMVTHLLRPAHIQRIAELVAHEYTPMIMLEEIRFFFERDLRCQVVIFKKGIPGLIGERIADAMLREAIFLVKEGVAEADDVDKVVREGISFYYSNIGILEDYDAARFLMENQTQSGKELSARESFYVWTKDRLEKYRENKQKVILQKQR